MLKIHGFAKLSRADKNIADSIKTCSGHTIDQMQEQKLEMSYLVSSLVDNPMLLLLALEASAISATAVVYFLSEGFRASNYKNLLNS